MAKEKAKPVQPKKMIALKMGFYKGKRIREGEIFDFTGEPGKWMTPADGNSVKMEKVSKKEKPIALSELKDADQPIV